MRLFSLDVLDAPFMSLLEAFLAARNEALGVARKPVSPPPLKPADLEVLLAQARACLELMERVWASDWQDTDPESSEAAPGDLEGGLQDGRACLELMESVWPRHFREASPRIAPDAASRAAAWLSTHAGRFCVLRKLSRGGYGSVFAAYDHLRGRTVALKVPPLEVSLNESLREQFLREAAAVARLDHPNILPIYEICDDEGQPYFSRKLVQGPSLQKLLPRLGGDVREATRILAAVARALHHAHERGVLHRCLKPSDVLFDRDGTPYVTDFGLSDQVYDADVAQAVDLPGTPCYLAPEHIAGKPAVSKATDVYGLGVLLYSALTGWPPFAGKDRPQVLDDVRFKAPQAPRKLNPRLDRDLEVICLKCLAKQPDKRYPSAEALAKDLEQWLAR
jgi:hypothetical protein